MKTIFFIFLLIISSNLVIAGGFSPSSLIFNLSPGEEECQKVSISSDSNNISVSDSWAENKDIKWGISSFDKEASYHELDLEYEKQLSISKREVEVCLSGQKIGEYHGVLLLKEEQKGNSIIQFGVWLKAVISEEKSKETISNQISSEASGGGESNISNLGVSNNNSFENIKRGDIGSLDNKLESNKKNGITGAIIGGISDNKLSIIIILIVLIILGLFIYRKRRI